MNAQLAQAPTINAPSPIRQMLRDCEEIANTPPDDAHKIGSLLQEMILKYYADVRLQAQQSFWLALGAACFGIGFYGFAVWRGMSTGGPPQANLAVITGTLINVISAINFYLYARAARQFGAFHVCLERTNRFILANCMCEKLCMPERDQMRMELARLVASASMLTLDVLTGETRAKQPRKLRQTTASGTGLRQGDMKI